MKVIEITVDDILDKFPSTIYYGDNKIWFYVNDQVAEYAMMQIALQKSSIAYKMGYIENVDNNGDDYLLRFFEVNDNDVNYIKNAPKTYLKYHDSAIKQGGLSEENGLVYDYISSIN